MLWRLCAFLALMPLLMPSGVCLCHAFEEGAEHAHHHHPLAPHHDPADHAPGCPAAKPLFVHRLNDAPPVQPPELSFALLPLAVTPVTAVDLLPAVETGPPAIFSKLPRYLTLCVLRN
jgi:hypothetical protein